MIDMQEITCAMMNSMKVAFFEIEDWEKEYLEQKLHGHELKFYAVPLTKENVDEIKDFEAISVFLLSKLDKEILDMLPNLKLVSTRSTGFDHIDCPACLHRNIVVSNVPHYGTHTVAEHTFSLILALS